MLRKNLGHKNVARFIFQNGFPELLDAPLRNEKPSQEHLQSILADGVTWYASLLLSLVEHDRRPGLAHARQMSTLEPDFRRQKQQESADAKQALAQGKRLCADRDSRKRTYWEMSATEQQLLEAFDTQTFQKRVEQTSTRTERIPFRGSLWNATEQPLQAPPRPAPTPQPPMPEGMSSKSSAAPPQSHRRPPRLRWPEQGAILASSTSSKSASLVLAKSNPTSRIAATEHGHNPKQRHCYRTSPRA